MKTRPGHDLRQPPAANRVAAYIHIRQETKLDDDNAKWLAESAELTNEAIGAIRTVASLALEADFLNEYARTVGGVTERSIRVLSFTIPYAMSQSIVFLVTALGFWYGLGFSLAASKQRASFSSFTSPCCSWDRLRVNSSGSRPV